MAKGGFEPPTPTMHPNLSLVQDLNAQGL